MGKLGQDFYLREDVVNISRELIGKFLVTRINGKLTSGMIIETEAYNGSVDKASHAYNFRRTARNEVMYHQGGNAYVYLCYGIHHLFNIVTNKKDVPHAVLIRAILAENGMSTMLKRRGMAKVNRRLSDGPGTLSQALGIKTSHSGTSLSGNVMWVEDKGVKFSKKEISVGPRIGVDYAGKDALLPYRFRLTNDVITKLSNEQFS
jgi:DNA-3-methyladenine glycosylase